MKEDIWTKRFVPNLIRQYGRNRKWCVKDDDDKGKPDF
jgi:hypothetical protein